MEPTGKSSRVFHEVGTACFLPRREFSLEADFQGLKPMLARRLRCLAS